MTHYFTRAAVLWIAAVSLTAFAKDTGRKPNSENFFPDKVKVFELMIRNKAMPFHAGNPVGTEPVGELFTRDLAEHQNASDGVKFKSICQDEFKLDTQDKFYSAPCKFTVVKKNNVNKEMTVTYSITVMAKKLVGNQFNEVSKIDLAWVERDE